MITQALLQEISNISIQRMSALTFVMRPGSRDLFLMKQLRGFYGNMLVTLLRVERIRTQEYYMAHMGLENLIYLL